MKPTYGAVSRYGMIAFASSLDQCGPLTRDVTDAALMLRHLQGIDLCDSTSLGIPGEIPLPSAERLDGLRFGVWGLEEEGLEPGVADVVRATLAKIEELGGGVEDVGMPSAGLGLSAYYVIAPAEASANLARYDGVRYGLRSGNGDLTSMYERTRHDGFGDEVKRRIMIGTYALSSGYYEAYYGKAQKVRTKIVEDFRAVFEKVDFLVTPTSPTVAFKLGERTADPIAMYLSDYFTVPMPLAGTPAISIPAGLSEGLPVGFQMAGPAFSEARILDAAYALERAIGFEGVPVLHEHHRARDARLRAGDRHRDPRAAEHAHEDVLRLRAVFRRRAQHPHLPGLPGAPGHAPGHERRGRPLRAHDRDGLRL